MSIKDIAITAREVCLVLIFVLLVLTPTWVKERLESAGFKRIDMGFAEWESQMEDSKEVVEETLKKTKETELELKTLSAELTNLTENREKVNSVDFNNRIGFLQKSIDSTTSDLIILDAQLNKSIISHDKLLEEIKTKRLEHN